MAKPSAISEDAKKGMKPLPKHLTQRHKDWLINGFDKTLFDELAQGQSPHSMVISCCDSRVNSTELFNTKSGEFFIHRNIANLVPPFDPNGAHHSTAAALEYAVTVLKVQHIIIIGHAACGGIAAGFDQCKNMQREHMSIKPADFGSLQKWIDLVTPAYERLDHNISDSEQVNDLERLSVIVSLEHLMGYSFIRDAVENDALSLHGLWHDIGAGAVHAYNPETGNFSPI